MTEKQQSDATLPTLSTCSPLSAIIADGWYQCVKVRSSAGGVIMHEHGSVSSKLSLWKAATRLRPLLLAAVLGLAAGAGALFPLVGNAPGTIVFACGLGNTPTMVANGAPALLYPVTTNVPASQPIGIFALNYAAGQTISFNEDMSRMIGAPPQKSLQWRWSFGDGTQSTEISPSHTYLNAGTYNVESDILSDGTWTFFDSSQIKVLPSAFSSPPVAKATASTHIIGLSGKITFDATGSHSADGSSLTYLWNFNDGSTATGSHVTHTFGIVGKGIVALIVTDDRGARSVATVNVQIVEQLPTAAVSASLTTIGTGNSVTFDASGSTPPGTPAGDQIVKYAWSFGDGTPQVTTSTPRITHRFNHAGTFTVTVEAIDQQGVPGTANIAITVVALSTTPGPPPWILYGGIGLIIAILALGGYLLYSNQRRRPELAREQAAAMERERLRRARSAQTQSQQGGYRRAASRPADVPQERGRQPEHQRSRDPGTHGDGW
jgi:PKD repeat protein